MKKTSPSEPEPVLRDGNGVEITPENFPHLRPDRFAAKLAKAVEKARREARQEVGLPEGKPKPQPLTRPRWETITPKRRREIWRLYSVEGLAPRAIAFKVKATLE